MNNFNLKRFALMLRWTLLSDRRRLLVMAIAFTGAFLLIQLAFTFQRYDIRISSSREDVTTAFVFMSGVFNLITSFFVSGICGHVRSGRQRATVLMLPASALEKFVSRLLYCAVIIPLLAAVALLAATGLRLLLELIAGHSLLYSGLDHYFSAIGFQSPGDAVSTVWFWSLFLLCGAFFRKLPYVWGWGLFLVLVIIVSTVFTLIFAVNRGQMDDFLMSFGDVLSWTNAFLAVLTVVNVWLSFRIFRRLKVVQNKFFNV